MRKDMQENKMHVMHVTKFEFEQNAKNRQEVLEMVKEGVNGFCMALADSVPGVSGGTVAFIMGFYDRFIGSVNDLAFGNKAKKKSAILYLAKLGIGWLIGMAMAVTVLATLFESQIYLISSLFIGFVAGAIPLIIKEEKECVKNVAKGIVFCLIGIAIVAGITWANTKTKNAGADLSQFSIGQAMKLFVIGMAAISAMFLPGISGSTLLLIFGAYIPVITAVKGVLGFHLTYIPSLMFFGCGVLAGAVGVVGIIRVALEKYRTQMVYLILGMMIGSLYAIVMGPTTLKVPKEALSLGNVNGIAVAVGAALLAGMQFIKEKK